MSKTTDWSTLEDRLRRVWDSVAAQFRTEALQDMLLQQLGLGDAPDEVVRSVRGAARVRLEFWLKQIVQPEGLERIRADWRGESPTGTDKTKKTTAERLREEALQDMFLKQSSIRFGDLPDEAVARVRAAEEAQLMEWARRLVNAETLEQVFPE